MFSDHPLTNSILPCDNISHNLHTEMLKEFITFAIGLTLFPSFIISGSGINSLK